MKNNIKDILNISKLNVFKNPIKINWRKNTWQKVITLSLCALFLISGLVVAFNSFNQGSMEALAAAPSQIDTGFPNIAEVIPSPDDQFLYVSGVASYSSTGIKKIDPEANTTLGSLDFTGYAGLGGSVDMTLNQDGTKLYVVMKSNDSIDSVVKVINTQTFIETGSITINNDSRYAVLNPSGTKLYIGGSYTPDVTVINTSSDTISTTISLGFSASEMVFSLDGSKIYMPGDTGVRFIDAATDTLNAQVLPMQGSSLLLSKDGTMVQEYIHSI